MESNGNLDHKRILALRDIAFNTFRDIVRNDAYLNLWLKKSCASLDQRDAAFLTSLIHTALDRLFYVDEVLSRFVQKKPKPVLQDILRLSITELLFMRTPVYAVANCYTELAKSLHKQESAGFINGVIRAINRNRDSLPDFNGDDPASLSVRYSCPQWIISQWIADYGIEHTIRLLQTTGSPTSVRAQYPFTNEELLRELPSSAYHGMLDENALYLEKGFDVTRSVLYAHGKLAIQSEGAMMLSRAIGDPSGLKILDACAAPGGKSAYLSSLAKNEIDLTCFEIHEHRLSLLNKTFERLHVQANTIRQDATVYVPEYDSYFDAVLLDVPCSGLGLIMDKPDIRYKKTPEDIERLVQIQQKILETCCRYVRPGGLLVYATCTINKIENEYQVDRFLAGHPEFMGDKLPYDESYRLQLFPDIHRTEGFFVARMKKCI